MSAQAVSATLSERSTSAIASLSTPATVTILALDHAGDTVGQGSGFLVRSTGVIITNFHVVKGASRAVILLATGERFARAEAVDVDQEKDIAVLKVPGYGLPVLTPTADIPAVGERVITIGSPRGLTHTVSEGIVSARRIVNGQELVQISAPISPGSSGGPVLDSQGRVFAIATKQITDGQQLNFAVPVRYALGLVSDPARTQPLPRLTGAEEAEPATRRSASVKSSGATAAGEPEGSQGDTVLDKFLALPVGVRPHAAQAPKQSLSGTYLLRYETRWPGLHRRGLDNFQVTLIGLAVFAADHSGYARRSFPSDSMSLVTSISPLNVAADGRVGLRLDGWNFDGYQTDDGFFVEGTGVDSDGDRKESRIRFQRQSLKLTATTGIYAARVRTTTEIRGRYWPEGALEWSGDLAVMEGQDSIYIDVTLRNNHGGGAGGYLAGPLLQNGQFSARDHEGRFTMTGQVVAGRLTADYTDTRDKGFVFKGLLRAQRE